MTSEQTSLATQDDEFSDGVGGHLSTRGMELILQVGKEEMYFLQARIGYMGSTESCLRTSTHRPRSESTQRYLRKLTQV